MPKRPRPTYNLAQKTQAMQRWAEGVGMRQVAQELHMAYRTLSNWKTKRDPEDWDTYKHTLAAKVQQKVVNRTSTDLAEMRTRHVQAARGLLNKAIQALLDKAPEEMTWSDIRASLVEAVKLERLAVGEATERSEIQYTPEQIIAMSDEELHQAARQLGLRLSNEVIH